MALIDKKSVLILFKKRTPVSFPADPQKTHGWDLKKWQSYKTEDLRALQRQYLH